MSERLREHIQLLGKRVIALVGSGVLLVIGVVDLVRAHHHGSAWFWLFWGCLILFLVEFSVVHKALGERDLAREQLARERTSPNHQSDLQARLVGFTQATTSGAEWGAGSDNQQTAFRAHFPDLMPTVEAWNSAVVRARAAPDALHAWIEAEYESLGLEEPTYVPITIKRLLFEVLIQNPAPGTHLQWGRTPEFGESADTTLRLYAGNVNNPLAFVDIEPRETLDERTARITAPVDDILARGQACDALQEVVASKEARDAMVQPAYTRFEPHFHATLYLASGCPFCDKQLAHRLRNA